MAIFTDGWCGTPPARLYAHPGTYNLSVPNRTLIYKYREWADSKEVVQVNVVSLANDSMVVESVRDYTERTADAVVVGYPAGFPHNN